MRRATNTISSRSKSARRAAVFCAALAALMLLAIPPVAARWMTPHSVPVVRLIENLQARLAEHPDDAQTHYNLGRIHALAFTLRREGILVYGSDERLRIAPGWQQQPPRAQDAPVQIYSEDQLREHLTSAIRHFNRALELDPTRAEFVLGLADVLDIGRDYAGTVDIAPRLTSRRPTPESIARAQRIVNDLGSVERAAENLELWTLRPPFHPGRAELREAVVRQMMAQRDDENPRRREAVRHMLRIDWEEQTTEAFFEAFTLGLPAESYTDDQPMRGLQELASYEAATQYIRLVETRGPRLPESMRLDIVKASLKAFDELPPSRAITPIVLHLTDAGSLADLLAQGTVVKFDLDGTGRPQWWPWVRPDTAILVWDPEGTGQITSGRQLFGSVTWWMMFEDGYRALDTLDDDRDGWLRSEELRGLSVWQDRNGNGIADPGEVTPVESLGIVAIAVRPEGVSEGVPWRSDGVLFADGRALPTWDWMPTAAAPPARSQLPPFLGIAGVLAGAGIFIIARRVRY